MSTFENFPTTEGTKTVTVEPKKNGFRGILTAVLVVALLGTWGYIIWDKNKTSETIQEKTTQLTAASTEKDELRKELDDATMRYDMIKTSSSNMEHSKDSVITKRDKEIADKQAKIQSILANANATKAQLADARSMIASLNTNIADYKTQIETLQGEKLVLTQQKEQVTQERDMVKKNYDSATVVIKDRDNTIDVASTLHASNFSITGINEKNNGKEKVTTTAKRVDKLRIAFDLDENRVTPSGTKDLYVAITAPDGTPVAVEALGSGKFTTREGQEKLYTQKVNVDYTQGQHQTVNFDWKQNSKFETGDYKIEIYQNGFKIGEGVRTLKKGGLFS
jgi:hypothetical protein